MLIYLSKDNIAINPTQVSHIIDRGPDETRWERYEVVMSNGMTHKATETELTKIKDFFGGVL